jgi:hypothetical protein
MVSEKKLAANRSNAQKSTGPKDTTKTRWNAVKHGILCQEIGAAIDESPEDLQQFEEFCEETYEEHKPQGPMESMLFNDMISLRWRRKRMLRYEAGAVDRFKEASEEGKRKAMRSYVLPKGLTPHPFLSTVSRGIDTDKVARYEAHLMRLYWGNVRALRELQAMREEKQRQQTTAERLVDEQTVEGGESVAP